jgi:hypothetical protein
MQSNNNPPQPRGNFCIHGSVSPKKDGKASKIDGEQPKEQSRIQFFPYGFAKKHI